MLITKQNFNSAIEKQSAPEIEVQSKQARASSDKEILFVWNYLEWGGAQIYFLGIMRLLAAKNCRVRAVMPEGTGEKLLGYFRQENVPTSFFAARIDGKKARNSWHKLRRRFNDLYCHFVLARHLSKLGLKNKIVQIEAAPWNAASLLFFLTLKAHVFVTFHISQDSAPTLRNRWIKFKYKLLCKSPNFHLLTSNEDMRQSLRWFVPDEFFQTIPVAYTGVNTAEIRAVLSQNPQSDDLLAKYNLPKNRIFVFSLGNIVERKGFRVLLEAASILRKNAPELFFVWIGDGEKHGEMQQLIEEKGLGERFKNIRPSEIGDNRNDLLQLLRLADVYVHPTFMEGLPGAMLEAMALGKPVVASAVNAIPEAVVSGENGILVEAGDADKFAEQILKLAADPELREKLGRRAQETVLNRFTEELCAAETIEFYEKCIGQRLADARF